MPDYIIAVFLIEDKPAVFLRSCGGLFMQADRLTK